MSLKKITSKFAATFLAVSLMIAMSSCDKKENRDSSRSKNQVSDSYAKRSMLLHSEFRVVKPSYVCMPQDRIFPNKMFSMKHKGKIYYGCCMGCIKKIKTDPNRYIWAKDPISGEIVDKAKAIILDFNGRALYFKSKENVLNFASRHGKQVIF